MCHSLQAVKFSPLSRGEKNEVKGKKKFFFSFTMLFFGIEKKNPPEVSPKCPQCSKKESLIRYIVKPNQKKNI